MKLKTTSERFSPFGINLGITLVSAVAAPVLNSISEKRVKKNNGKSDAVSSFCSALGFMSKVVTYTSAAALPLTALSACKKYSYTRGEIMCGMDKWTDEEKQIYIKAQEANRKRYLDEVLKSVQENQD